MKIGSKPRKTLLITGAAGFLGFAVVKAAKAAGYNVHGIGRQQDPSRLKGSDVNYRSVDLADARAVEDYLAEIRPDAIIHSAWTGVSGQARDQELQYDNIHATLRLIEIGKKYGLIKFVGIGSQAEYGRFEGRVDETRVPAPITLYGAAKHAAYTLARQRALTLSVEFAWLRLFAIYGPGDNPNWLIPSLIRSIGDNQSPPMTAGIQKWDYLYIDDAADAVLSALESNETEGAYNLSSGSALAVRSIAEMIRDEVAPDLSLEFGAIPYGPAQIFHMEGDITRLIHATNWRPEIDLITGLRKTIQSAKAPAPCC